MKTQRPILPHFVAAELTRLKPLAFLDGACRTAFRSQRRKESLGRVLLIAILAVTSLVVPAATIQLPSLDVGVGSQFTLPVTVNSGSSALGRYDLEVRYNPAILAVTGVTGGVGEFAPPLFSSTNSSGRILLSDENLTSLSSPTGSITVAQITFSVIGGASSTTSVYFASAALLTTDALPLSLTATPASIQIASLPAVVKIGGTNVGSLEPFSAPLTVDSGLQPLGRYEVELHFATNVLRLLGVSGQGFFASPLLNSNTPGKIILSADNLTSLASPTGLVTVAGISFLSIGGLNSSSPLSIHSSSVFNTDGSSLAATNLSALVQVDPDGNGNSIPDWWEIKYFGSTNADLALDQDGDGVSNADEYSADTNPTNAASYLHFTAVVNVTAGTKLDWFGGSNAWKYLQRTDSFNGTNTAWLNFWTSPPPPSADSGSYTDAVGTNTAQFYRIKATR